MKNSSDNEAKAEIIINTSEKKNSWVWPFYRQVQALNGDIITICEVEIDTGVKCNKRYKTKGSTGNLINHLLKHGITKDNPQPQKITKITSKPSVIPHEEKKQQELRQHLVNWLVCDSRPLSIVQNEFFHRFVDELDPRFNIPDVKLIKQIIHKAYNYAVPLLKEDLKNNAIKVSLTMDLWTSHNRKGYIGITCSYIDENFKLNEITLSIQYIAYPHTATHIRETVNSIIDYWELNEKVQSIVTDNAANIKKAVSGMANIDWQGCSSHTLQLVVGKSMKPCRALIARAKRLIQFFLQPKHSEQLEEVQKLYPNKSSVDPSQTSDYLIHCISDCITRWNSSYLAWTRLVQIKPYISLMINHLLLHNDSNIRKDGKQLRDIMLTESEWDLIIELLQVLGPIEEATTCLGGSKYTTHSLLYRLIESLKKRFKPNKNDRISNDKLDFNTEDDVFDEDNDFEFEFNNDENTQIQININTPLYELYEERKAFAENEKNENEKQTQTNNIIDKCSNTIINLLYVPSLIKSLDKEEAIQNEVNEYLDLPQIGLNNNSLVWWELHSTKFPILSELSRIYLAIPATSTPVSDCLAMLVIY
ncbi:zinc finger BED domain-containing protein 1-like [Rhizophagus clarus]|uniref:Zinc finger BED domain-containing protein 1-like n=1 Tax=Rhizophagus clarus TaxID=94130 RepID=A0A8H3M6J7_9GLOM|nr:zinc finger BED domain-containing protein 1-like [Rhizophagus clarus]